MDKLSGSKRKFRIDSDPDMIERKDSAEEKRLPTSFLIVSILFLLKITSLKIVAPK
jgi:hypothetical protein